MRSERSMGVFILVCGLFCLTIAVDKYYSAKVTAQAQADRLAEVMPEFQLEGVAIPTQTLVCGPVGVMLLVASVILIARSFRPGEQEASAADLFGK